MNTRELMLFYADMENREWELLISSKPPSEINPEDFAHVEFCAAVRRCMIMQSLARNLISNRPDRRYWAGLRLYEYWAIEKSFPHSRN
jgi:hypothetical protein